jgi:hypothetical protein
VTKAFLFLSLLVAVSSQGQTTHPGSSTGPSSSSRSHRAAVPGGERSMKGCLTKDEGGAYVLQTQRNAKVRLDSAEDLAPRIGRQIKVTGAFVDTQSSGAASDPNRSSSRPSERSHSVRVFRVFKVDVLSQTCNARKK